MTSAERDRKEKLEILRNERGVAIVDYARLQQPSPGGRWAKIKDQEAASQYPMLKGGPWFPNPVEPPLGYSVSAPIDLGEPIPLEASATGQLAEEAEPAPTAACDPSSSSVTERVGVGSGFKRRI